MLLAAGLGRVSRRKGRARSRGKRPATWRSHPQLTCSSMVASHVSEKRETGRILCYPLGWAWVPTRLLQPPELCRLCRLDAQVAGWGRPPPSSLTFSGGWLLEELRLTVTVPWLGSRPGWRLHSYSVFIYLLSLGWSQGGPNPTSLPWAPSALETPALPKLLWFPPAETSILRQGAGPKTVMEVLVLAPHLGMCPPSSAPALFWDEWTRKWSQSFSTQQSLTLTPGRAGPHLHRAGLAAATPLCWLRFLPRKVPACPLRQGKIHI